MGKGKQSFLKAEFALREFTNGKDLDVVLLEEPENHLSHSYMKKMISKIQDNINNSQIFVTTHSSLITSRLGLKHAIFLTRQNGGFE